MRFFSPHSHISQPLSKVQSIKKLGFIFIENRNNIETKNQQRGEKNAQKKMERDEQAKTNKNNIFNIWGERIKAFHVMIKFQSSAAAKMYKRKSLYIV